MILLVRDRDNTQANPVKSALMYKKGDVVLSRAEDSPLKWGRLESFRQWVAEGSDPARWPGGFVLVTLDMSAESFEPDLKYLFAGDFDNASEWMPPAGEDYGALDIRMTKRRRHAKVDFEPMERRAVGSGRDTLRTEFQITRRYSEVKDMLVVK